MMLASSVGVSAVGRPTTPGVRPLFMALTPLHTAHLLRPQAEAAIWQVIPCWLTSTTAFSRRVGSTRNSARARSFSASAMVGERLAICFLGLNLDWKTPFKITNITQLLSSHQKIIYF